jgi:predicted DNA-binding transcriptional regulator AlpA
MSRLVEQSKPRRSPPVAKAADTLAEAIEGILTRHAERYANTRPEMMLDRDIRARYFPGLSRTTYWQLTKRPDFPKAAVVSPKVRLRKRVEIERWLAEQPEAA